MADPQRVRTIFLEAVEHHAPDQWSHFLDRACGEDQDLRKRLEVLLRAHEQANSMLDVSVVSPVATIDQPTSQVPGTLIGPYKLIELIGEGGMGTVWMAQQTEPVKRVVALKLIKAGMDSKQIIARFEAERQALALMDHPNIARVIDGGTTGTGRPYFVMDLVKGVPITKYCDEHHLTPRERLELFLPVCQAVQHAHQKGVIHRDLKPSNVLVALYDGKPVPKVIDFGVAKAAGQSLTDKTLVTGFGQVVGTLEYMSPEQAEINQLDIDTRSDIYSLGVLLYELLTGSPPFTRKELTQAGMLEMLRVIREQEPSKPSTKLSTAEGLPTLAANRGTEPAKLTKLVRGELDWIVMKALEKDRKRRYETANGFAMEVQRYLADEPVLACPPSSVYRLKKFVRRNKAALAIATLVLFFLTVLGGGVGWALRDRSARQARVTGQLEVIMDETARLQQAEKWSEALTSARRAEPALAMGVALPDIQERVRQVLADLELVQRLEEIRAQSGTVWGSWNPKDTTRSSLAMRAEQDYAAALREIGIDVDTLPVKEAAQRIAARDEIGAALLPALDDWVAVRSKVRDEAATQRLVDVLRTADPDPWRQRVRDCLARKDWPALEILARSPELDRQPAATISFLCAALRQQAEADITRTDGDAEANFQKALRGFLLEIDVLRRAQWKYPADYWINHRFGISLIGFKAPALVVAEGIGFMRAAVAVRPQSGHAISNLGNGYHALRELDQAVACFRKAIELDPRSATWYSNLGIVLGEKGLYEEAIAAFEQAINLKPDRATRAYAELATIHSNRPDAHLRNARRAAELAAKAIELEPQISNHWTALGLARYREGEWQEARSALDRSLELRTNPLGGWLRWEEAINWFFLAMCHRQLAQTEEARQCYEKGVTWMEKNQPNSEQLIRLRAEAEELLKITDERKATEAVDARGAAEAFADLGRLRVRQGDFRQAAADYAKAIELEPAREYVSFQGGSLLAHLGRREAFRKHCAAMLERFGDTQDRSVAERTAKLMSSVPTEFSGVDPKRVAALADKAIASPPSHQDVEMQWFHLAKGMADYRAGRFDSVALSMKKAKTPHWPVRTVLADLYLSMAQFQLGEREISVKTLDRAVAMMVTQPQPGCDDLGDQFHDYLFCRLARREAEALILKPAREPTTDKTATTVPTK